MQSVLAVRFSIRLCFFLKQSWLTGAELGSLSLSFCNGDKNNMDAKVALEISNFNLIWSKRRQELAVLKNPQRPGGVMRPITKRSLLQPRS